MPKARVTASPKLVELLRAAFVADCGCDHPKTHQAEAVSVAEVLHRAGYAVVHRDALRKVTSKGFPPQTTGGAHLSAMRELTEALDV